ncbi:uncharacterized protein LOC116160225 isoform X2 [Photinus pyralis]|uniref:uncharacterized protein LOC116160225 isoform X2 n=1 Tax=Photinus pyralis TaxID=7054 RepID=UPI001266E911|nr:uncharacterized protein LOC116160225 isoform X2 [Photinus pyralis]
MCISAREGEKNFISKGNVWCLKSVILTLEPAVVQRYHYCTLMCNYDLEGAPLYTVKWYRGLHEFYRYTPNEYPNTKIFPIGGITVDFSPLQVNHSNSTQVVLRNVEFNLSGNFSCEVTTEEGFSTGYDTKTMLVVQLPEEPPTISVSSEPLDYGDVLRANCSSPPSRPPATLKFILNNRTVAKSETIITKKSQEMLWSDLYLELPLSEVHFNGGRLILRCEAQIADMYLEYAELRLDSVRDPVPERVSAVDRASRILDLTLVQWIIIIATILQNS